MTFFLCLAALVWFALGCLALPGAGTAPGAILVAILWSFAVLFLAIVGLCERLEALAPRIAKNVAAAVANRSD